LAATISMINTNSKTTANLH